jgi:LysR family hydrogen peroxide-inducible transcriptional activator
MSVIPTIAPFLLPSLLPKLRAERPALQLYLREETSHAALDSLRHGHADCVLLALPFPCGDVETEVLFSDPLFVAFPKDDPRDPPAQISPDMIDGSRLLLLEDGHCLKDHALAACNRAELRGEATITGTSLHTLVQMVDNGLGLTLLPEMAIRGGILTNTDITARPIRSPTAHRDIALIWRRNSPRETDFRLMAGILRNAAARQREAVAA